MFKVLHDSGSFCWLLLAPILVVGEFAGAGTKTCRGKPWAERGSFGFTSSNVQNSDRSPGNFSSIINTEDTGAPLLSSMAIDIHVAYPTESPRPETNDSVIETLSVTESSQIVAGSFIFYYML